MKIGIYPGSFDPVTLGHLDIIRRSAKLFDKLYIGVLNNSAKNALFSPEERVAMLKQVTEGISNIQIEAFSGLLADYANLRQANAIVRGLRAVTDFEYELSLAQTNHAVYENIDTVFLATSVEYSYLSSSIVKEVAMYGGDIHKFVPAVIMQMVYDKLGQKGRKQ